MIRPRLISTGVLVQAAICAALLSFMGATVNAQARPSERTFRESKPAVEKALKQLRPSMSGRLPALEGFALVGDHPLTRYQRGFYQCTAQVSATPSGTLVGLSAKVTAWYADANPSRSGYQLLVSNGRLESDLLDQLSDQLSSTEGSAGPSSSATIPPARAKRTASDEPTLSAPMPRPAEAGGSFLPSVSKTLPGLTSPGQQSADFKPAQKETTSDAQTKLAALEEVLKNQARPKNLVAIKKSGTPVLASPSLTGKTLFLASAHDEFEMLDFNDDWIHVRISGLSRGWIWRTSLEMPEGISDVPLVTANSAPTVADIFQVSREESAPFPGDWGPLRGKNVKILTVQKIRENDQDGGARAKLEFAKSLLDQSYDALAKSQDLAGLVLIFDAVDGGMIAATLPTIARWKAGGLTDAALWHQCYFDPPETFSLSSAKAVH
ncbi:MAG: hypothetical protein WA172_13650 [Terriglobales bacterium]